MKNKKNNEKKQEYYTEDLEKLPKDKMESLKY